MSPEQPETKTDYVPKILATPHKSSHSNETFSSQPSEIKTDKLYNAKKEADIAREQYGIAIDPTTAKYVLPYALIARDAYNDIGGDVGIATKWKRISTWEEELLRNHVSRSVMDEIRSSGFHAAIYKNQQTGEVNIAFRGTQPNSIKDLATGS